MAQKIIFSVLAVALTPFFAWAQESAPAGTTESGGKKIVIELPEIPVPEDVKIKISGFVQAQFVAASASGDASDQNGFSIRRSNIGVSADVGEDWSAKIVYEVDSGSGGGDSYSDYIDTAVISRNFDAGKLIVGHKKNHFMYEEYSSASKFLCIERSLNSNFVTGNSYVRGLSGYHIGVFWEGKLGKNFDYGASLTNAVARDYDAKSNDLAVTGNIGYTLNLTDDSKLYLGVNGTVNFGDDGTLPGQEMYTGTTTKTALSNAGIVYGVNPYIRYTCGGFTALADLFYINGDSDSKIHSLYGVNLTAAYLLECGLEPAVRFTYLNTDSGIVGANTQNRVPATGGHNNATTYFLGVNYYFNKHVKLATGYEYGHYFGKGAHADDSGAFRSMLQILF